MERSLMYLKVILMLKIAKIFILGKKNIGQGKEEKFKREMIESFDKYVKKFQKMVGWS